MEDLGTLTWGVVLGMAALFLVGLALDWARGLVRRVEELEARVDILTETVGLCCEDIMDLKADGKLDGFAYDEEGDPDGGEAEEEE